MRIITNADDLGESAATNHAIFGLMAEGVVTSASILANARGTDDACRQTKDFPNCSFGVHLNLTEFRPLAMNRELGVLLNERGDFSGEIRSIRNLAHLRKGIFEELAAQIEHVRSMGVNISHIDSHHHTHTIPVILPVIWTLLRSFNIRKVRISKNLYSRSDEPGLLTHLKKAIFNTALRKSGTVRTTDYFTDISGLLDHRAKVEQEPKLIEVMLHPGGPEGEDETQTLRDLTSRGGSFRDCLLSYHDF